MNDSILQQKNSSKLLDSNSWPLDRELSPPLSTLIVADLKNNRHSWLMSLKLYGRQFSTKHDSRVEIYNHKTE